MLHERTLNFRKFLNVGGFIARMKWFKRFKATHNILFWALQNETKDVLDMLCGEQKTVS